MQLTASVLLQKPFLILTLFTCNIDLIEVRLDRRNKTFCSIRTESSVEFEQLNLQFDMQMF